MTAVFKPIHKGPVGCARFSKDGRYVATGSADASLKVIAVSKAKALYGQPPLDSSDPARKPVIRSLYGHTEPVSDVDFHPNGRVLASVSLDGKLGLYDLTRAQHKRHAMSWEDVVPLRSLDFHPTGDYLLLAGDDHRPRLMDVQTMTPYLLPTPNSTVSHRDRITCIRYANDAATFATASDDGDIRIYDTKNGSLIRVIASAHDGRSVSSIQYSLSNRYVLSCGRDNRAKVWDISSGLTVRTYEGAIHQRNAVNATWNWNESLVLSSDESQLCITAWDAGTADIIARWRGHELLVRCVAASPIENFFISCGDDNKARCWMQTNAEN